MNSYNDILAKLREAKGMNRELDCLLYQTDPDGYDKAECLATIRKHGAAQVAQFAGQWGIPCYTSSIDVALALVEKLLPGCSVQMSRRTTAWVSLHDYDAEGRRTWRSDAEDAPTLPLAILIALFEALKA